MELDHVVLDPTPLATEWWNSHPELRKSLTSHPATSLASSLAPKPLSSSENDLTASPLPPLVKWASSISRPPTPFRLFGEALPHLSVANVLQVASSIMMSLSRHYNLILFSVAAQSDLSNLVTRFNVEVQHLWAYIEAQEDLGVPGVCFLELEKAMATQMMLVLERSTPSENDPKSVLLCSYNLHICWTHILALAYNKNREIKEARDLLDAQSALIFGLWAKAGPSDLRRFMTDHSQLLPYYSTAIRVISELFAAYRNFDEESVPGAGAWSIISSAWRNFTGEAKWRALVLAALINTSNLDYEAPKDAPTVMFPAWDLIQELLADDLLQKPTSRNSPTKEPNGPSKGIADIVRRLKFFTSIWDGAPQSASALALVGRYFAERSLWKLGTPLELFDHLEGSSTTQTGPSAVSQMNSNSIFSASSNTNSFDMYLHLVHFTYTKMQNSKDANKLKMNTTKLVELFLNVLDDFPTTLDPSTESPALVRNAFQLSVTLVPFMTDTDIQHILMERLFSVPFEILAHSSALLMIKGSFALLECLSTRLPPPEFEDSQMADSMLEIYGTAGNLDIEASLIPFAGSRARIATYLCSKILDHIVASYTRASTADRSAPNTLMIQLSQSPFKRAKHLDVSDGSTLNAHEKLIRSYLQRTRKIYQNHLSSASILLLAPNIEPLLVNLHTSIAIRQEFNASLQSLILQARKTSLEPAMRKQADSLWIVWQRSITSTSPTQAVEQSAAIQGSLMFALSMESPASNWTEVMANSADKESAFRCLPLWTLRAYTDLLHQTLKSDVYTTTVTIPSDYSVAAIAILILAFLEATKPAAVVDTMLKLRDIAALPIVIAKKYPELALLTYCIHHEGFMEAIQQPLSNVNFASRLLTSVIHWNQQNSQKAVEYAACYPLLLKFVDAVILKNRSEISSNPPQLSTYDDKIYPFIALCLQLVPNWLHNQSDLRQNVLGKLVTELFLAPLRAMTPLEITTPSSSTPPISYGTTSTGSLQSMAASMANQRQVKTSTGMVVGFAKSSGSGSTSSSSSSSSSLSRVSTSNRSSTIVKPPINVNQNAIKYLPALITGLTRLNFSYDADLQRYLCDTVVATFQSFLGGKEGFDGRLIEQLAAGLAASEAIPTMADAVKSAYRNQSRDFRVFFLANVLPWLVSLIEDGPDDLFDTNAFILARLLGWIVLKLKRTPNSSLDIVKVFLMGVHCIMDLFRARKPTKSNLAKREMLGFVSIFCSTMLKLVPGSPVTWLKGIDVALYGAFETAMKEVVFAILRDVEYISAASWPLSPPQAPLLTMNLNELKNAIFERTVDQTAHLSTLVLAPDLALAPAEALGALCKVHIEVLEFVRQLGLESLISDIHERIRSLIYVPTQATTQRHARGDIKVALEIWRQGYGRTTYRATGSS